MRVGTALFIAVLIPLVAAMVPAITNAQSVIVTAGGNYTIAMYAVDAIANTTVTWSLAYVDETSNETITVMSVDGTTFYYNSTEPLVLIVSASTDANITFNQLVTQLTSKTSGAAISKDNPVVKFSIAAKPGDKVKIEVKSENDPYSRIAVAFIKYADGTYERVIGQTYYSKWSYTAYLGSDPDWPSTITDERKWHIVTPAGYSITKPIQKQATEVIVGLPTYLHFKWNVKVTVIPGSSNTATQTTTNNNGSEPEGAEQLSALLGGSSIAPIVLLLGAFVILLIARR